MRGGPAQSSLDAWGPHSLQPPCDGSGKGDGAHKAFHVSVKARRGPPPVLDAAEHALDGIAAIERGLVIILLDYAIAARRNDGLRDSFFEPFAQRAATLVLGCLIPDFDGALLSPQWRDALWARFFTAAPQRLRQSVEQYSIVKRA